MRKLNAWDGVALLSIAAAFAASWSVYEQLPETVATHFGIDGKPNGWMPRPYAAWGIPVFAIVLWAFTRYVSFILPKKDQKRLGTGAMALVAMMTAVLVSAVHVVVLYVALVPHVDVTRIVFAMVSVFFVALGLIMPRLRRNPIIGIRTPWTLTNEENWARTHRVAGYSMVGGGLLAGLCGLIGGPVGVIAALVCLLGSAILPAVWSLLYARRHDPS